MQNLNSEHNIQNNLNINLILELQGCWLHSAVQCGIVSLLTAGMQLMIFFY